MEQQAILAELVRERYGALEVTLRVITPYLTAKRAVERVEVADGRRWVLRAFQGDADTLERELRGQAAVLAYLARRGYPAPRVVRTRDGQVIASHAGWAAIVLSWTEGTPAGFDLDALERLGETVARLHALSAALGAEEDEAVLPDCRLRPPAALPAFAPASRLPQPLRAAYDTWVATLRRMSATASQLPLALLHGDCWPGNAIVAHDGALALVDWDGAGLGPAVLDLGYLLLTCHLGQTDPFLLRPDPAAIGAVVRGYSRGRRVTPAELDALEDAVRYDLARRMVLEGALVAAAGRWETDTQVRKSLAREAIAGEVAALARAAFEKETDMQ